MGKFQGTELRLRQGTWTDDCQCGPSAQPQLTSGKTKPPPMIGEVTWPDRFGWLVFGLCKCVGYVVISPFWLAGALAKLAWVRAVHPVGTFACVSVYQLAVHFAAEAGQRAVEYRALRGGSTDRLIGKTGVLGRLGPGQSDTPKLGSGVIPASDIVIVAKRLELR